VKAFRQVFTMSSMKTVNLLFKYHTKQVAPQQL